jgi:hypothetical protein
MEERAFSTVDLLTLRPVARERVGFGEILYSGTYLHDLDWM